MECITKKKNTILLFNLNKSTFEKLDYKKDQEFLF